MDIPGPETIRSIEEMARKGASFALCRKPWTDEPIFVLQTHGQPLACGSPAALDGAGPAYVAVPFRVTPQCPVVSIRPDIVAHGWEETAAAAARMAAAPAQAAEAAPPPALLPGGMEEALRRHAAAFARCQEAIGQGAFSQLAPACAADLPAPPGFTPLGAFIKACNSYPRMMVYLLHSPLAGTWLGCTPEVLLAGQGKEWSAAAIDAAQPVEGAAPQPQWPPQSLRRQANTAAALRATLRQLGLKPVEKGPATARAGHLLHLKTDFAFHLKDTAHIGTLLDSLCPAPSVCGAPAKEAASFIADHEGCPREYYAGAIGWLDPQGATKLYVNLRCLRVTGNTLRLYTGGSVLPGDTLGSAQEDILLKMQTLTRIINNGL